MFSLFQCQGRVAVSIPKYNRICSADLSCKQVMLSRRTLGYRGMWPAREGSMARSGGSSKCILANKGMIHYCRRTGEAGRKPEPRDT